MLSSLYQSWTQFCQRRRDKKQCQLIRQLLAFPLSSEHLDVHSFESLLGQLIKIPYPSIARDHPGVENMMLAMKRIIDVHIGVETLMWRMLTSNHPSKFKWFSMLLSYVDDRTWMNMSLDLVMLNLIESKLHVDKFKEKHVQSWIQSKSFKDDLEKACLCFFKDLSMCQIQARYVPLIDKISTLHLLEIGGPFESNVWQYTKEFWQKWDVRYPYVNLKDFYQNHLKPMGLFWPEWESKQEHHELEQLMLLNEPGLNHEIKKVSRL